MRRREFIATVAGTVVSPIAARAQQKAMPVVGVLTTGSSAAVDPILTAFYQGLSEAGFVEGQSVEIEHRGAEGRYDRLPALAADLVGRKVDVIVSYGGFPSTLAAKSATSTIPIVFLGSDPIGDGFVASLARPGGNLTGVSLLGVELMPKRLELLTELVPETTPFVLLVNPANPNAERVTREGDEAARAKGIRLTTIKARSESEIESAFASLAQFHAHALIVQADPYFTTRRDQLIGLSARYAVPTIYYFREFAAFGGLISYGSSLPAAFHQLGTYVGKILKGAKPADLPVEQPTKFELVINLKTANALGLAVPQSLLARADEVIE